jgi:hypothetical protein
MGEISPNREMKNSKNSKKGDFGGFQSPEVRENQVKTTRFLHLGVQSVVKI